MPRPRRAYSRKPRAKYAWESSSFDPATLAPGSQVTAQLLSANLGGVAGILAAAFTVVRIIGSLRVNSDDATLSVEWAAGIAPIMGDAVTANVFPDPHASDDQFPWQWWMSRVSPPAGAGGLSIQVELDIKAQRRMTGNQRLMFILNNHDAFETLEFSLSTRVLVKLP